MMKNCHGNAAPLLGGQQECFISMHELVLDEQRQQEWQRRFQHRDEENEAVSLAHKHLMYNSLMLQQEQERQQQLYQEQERQRHAAVIAACHHSTGSINRHSGIMNASLTALQHVSNAASSFSDLEQLARLATLRMERKRGQPMPQPSHGGAVGGKKRSFLATTNQDHEILAPMLQRRASDTLHGHAVLPNAMRQSTVVTAPDETLLTMPSFHEERLAGLQEELHRRGRRRTASHGGFLSPRRSSLLQRLVLPNARAPSHLIDACSNITSMVSQDQVDPRCGSGSWLWSAPTSPTSSHRGEPFTAVANAHHSIFHQAVIATPCLHTLATNYHDRQHYHQGAGAAAAIVSPKETTETDTEQHEPLPKKARTSRQDSAKSAPTKESTTARGRQGDAVLSCKECYDMQTDESEKPKVLLCMALGSLKEWDMDAENCRQQLMLSRPTKKQILTECWRRYRVLRLKKKKRLRPNSDWNMKQLKDWLRKNPVVEHCELAYLKERLQYHMLVLQHHHHQQHNRPRSR